MMRRIIGCMTGTSIDAVDAALMEIQGTGLEISARFIRGASGSLGELAPVVRQIAEQQPVAAGALARVARELALRHASIVAEVAGDEGLDLICVHGQTVFHAPPLSWQLFNPAPLVRAIGVPVVFDLRGADLAAGGQGAPITPIADWILFRNAEAVRGGARAAVVNLGGFANITLLPPARRERLDASSRLSGLELEVAQIGGWDVCSCNQLLDAIARDLLGEAYDMDGRHAARGEVHSGALADLREILERQSRGGRSLGTGDEARAWIGRWQGTAAPRDLCATACQAIASTVSARLHDCVAIMAGGGVRNRALAGALESCCPAGAYTSDEVGIPAEFREAACFAVLGALCQDRIPITLPKITGVDKAPVAGCWMYP